MTTDELRQAIEALPSLPEAERFTWLFRRKNLREKILSENPEEFLTWPIVRECLFVGNAPYIDGMYDELINDKDWNRYGEAIGESFFGKPEAYRSWTSGNLISQAYHIKQWEDTAGYSVADIDSVVESGAGYGAMAYVYRRSGFRGNYTIVDLPEFALLQEYYLSNTVGIDGIHWWSFPGLPSNAEYDLCIAICSLSEVDIETRNLFLERVNAKSYLVVFQPIWDGIDNMAYFTKLRDDNSHLQWRIYPNPHYQNHWYLIGS